MNSPDPTAADAATRTQDSSLIRALNNAVEKLRLKLLDLTLRNPLLNYGLNAAKKVHLRVIDELPDALYQRLTDTGASQRLYLNPLPPLPEKTEKDSSGLDGTLEAWARKHRIDPSFELPKPSNVANMAHRDDKIQTLMVPKLLEAAAQKLRLQQLTAEQELGFGTLHVSFGYLEWYEDDASQKALYAPLVLLPVRIDRELKGGTYRYFTEAGEGQDPLTNICLREKLLKLYAIQIPDLDEDDTPESYWKRVAIVVRGKNRWRIVRSVTIGHLAFARLAMYEDLDDERWDQAPQLQELVSDLLAGATVTTNEGATNTLHANVYDVDDESIARKVPYVITDLDSSQFSAVADAVDGKSFALQGPPGTGKSQTITAMIAAALADGKTVLFIAEKMAALDVVAKRLTDVGLGPFLLELHSTKTNKRRMLDAFSARVGLKKARHSRFHESLDINRSRLEAERAQLKRYVEVLNTPVALSGHTLHEIFWHEQLMRRQLDETRLDVSKLPLVPQIETVTPVVQGKWQLAFREYGARRLRVVSVAADMEHPLDRVKQPGVSQFDIPVLDAAIGDLRKEINQFLAVVQVAGQAIGELIAPVANEIVPLVDKLGSVPIATEVVDGRILAQITDDKHTVHELETGKNALRAIAEGTVAVRASFESLEQVLGNAAAVSHPIAELRNLYSQLALLDSEATVDSVCQRLEVERGTLSEVLEALKLLRVLEGRLEIPSWSQRAQGLDATLDLIDLLRTTASDTLAHRHSGLRARDATAKLTALERACEAAKQSVNSMKAGFDLPDAITAEQLRQHATDLEQVRGLAYLFTSKGRAIRAFTRRLNHGKLAPKDGMAKACRQMAATLEHVRQLEAELTTNGVVGPFARGLMTPFQQLGAAASFFARARDLFPELDSVRAPLQNLCLTATAEQLEATLGFAGQRSVALRNLRSSQRWTDDSANIGEGVKSRTGWISEIRSLTAKIHSVGGRLDATLGQWEAGTLAAESIRAALHTLLPWESWLSLSATVSSDSHEVITRVDGTLNYIIAVSSIGLSRPISRLLLGPTPTKQGQRVHGAARGLSLELQKLGRAFRHAHESIGFDQNYGSADLESMARQLERAIALPPEAKTDWMQHLQEIQSIDQAGLTHVRSAIDVFELTAEQVEAAFRTAYLRSLIKHVQSQVGRETLKPGTSLAEARARLAELDRQYVDLSAKRLSEVLLDRKVPEGVSVGPVKHFTDLGLIRHEIGKQRANISIRSLLRRSAQAAQALKPCFLMSPASVSHFLPSVARFFDLLVIDEASQMRPEDALVALSRAKQAVIVGDPKQLPPSAFFAARGDDTSWGEDPDDEEEKLTTDDESILDRALGALPYRDLQWHYRSRHQSLIAFSNREFYRDRLTVFPSPVDQSSDLGVSSIYVEDGCYQSSRNPREAQRVLEVAAELARTRPDRSIGVVAMNLHQTELLNQEWDRLCATNQDLEEYRLKWADTLESFFIKNLENVQGDERDIIVISTVYGPESPGAPVLQRFGPINQSQGARRLNVLFTRAKARVVVVTSMRPDNIQAESDGSQGRGILRRYLEYANTGRLEGGATDKDGGFDSPFEEEVAKVLEDHSFQYATQVGVAGYRIDLAVRSPLNPSYFMVGIECDGATYHSARCARDRDRLREEVLLRLGWKLYRIWSTDWFHSRQSEIKRLVHHLRALTPN